MARHLPKLQAIWVYGTDLGWEGVAAVAGSLIKLEVLDV